MEFKRNRERYQFLKWGQQAFKTFQLIPPGIGIVHQVNLEYLAKGVLSRQSECQRSEIRRSSLPDTLVGTDSHTTMINGLGVVGWGVGGIEAEAGMLGQPVYFLTPEVVGVHMSGQLARRRYRDRSGPAHHPDAARAKSRWQVCRVLRRRRRLVAGAGSRDDRQHVARVRRDHGIFPDRPGVGELFARNWTQRRTMSSRSRIIFARRKCSACRAGAKLITASISNWIWRDVQPSVAGPKRPQDRINLPELGQTFRESLCKNR